MLMHLHGIKTTANTAMVFYLSPLLQMLVALDVCIAGLDTLNEFNAGNTKPLLSQPWFSIYLLSYKY
ncbi:hypothetical protein [Psychroflexus montanilacus]|uniref:hypothetical protein n=1 Tax=Psychroflexus montanilacus TaxID=2873598 RepID=UPI001CCB1939|nr:hypothetical protein [Psychroflexus montanilacus]MBZ9651311.1 hypothetical protein [Psychroflexus montanilacus]